MAIKKQEFYEGAALHLLIRGGGVTKIVYKAPLFEVNDRLLILLKYTTKGRSPWGFTFMPDEQILLHTMERSRPLVIGLICAFDGVAVITEGDFRSLASPTNWSVHISCYREHRGHYEINGPIGTLPRKVPPIDWQRLLDQ